MNKDVSQSWFNENYYFNDFHSILLSSLCIVCFILVFSIKNLPGLDPIKVPRKFFCFLSLQKSFLSFQKKFWFSDFYPMKNIWTEKFSVTDFWVFFLEYYFHWYWRIIFGKECNNFMKMSQILFSDLVKIKLFKSGSIENRFFFCFHHQNFPVQIFRIFAENFSFFQKFCQFILIGQNFLKTGEFQQKT